MMNRDANGFTFNSKGEVLEQLRKMNIKSKILPGFRFSVYDWTKKSPEILDSIMYLFRKDIIVRSSAVKEDNKESSNAGHYESVLGVDIKKREEIEQAVYKVINSFEKDDLWGKNEVLIQEMASDILFAGVVFTYDIENHKPYYVISHGKNTTSTNNITAGEDLKYEVIKIIRKAKVRNPIYKKIVEGVREIEEITGVKYLDIEFGYTNTGEIYIFQVRPLVIPDCPEFLGKPEIIEKRAKEILDLETEGIYGKENMLSNMTDWNPAELVGTHPHKLDWDLYKFIFTDSAWHKGRALLGYRALPEKINLVEDILGHPFINIKVDFNSYIPRDIPPELIGRIIDNRILKLKKEPKNHDKAEFLIIDSCYSPLIDPKEYEKSLSPKEINFYFESLKKLTNEIICDKYGVLKETIQDFEKIVKRTKKNLLQSLQELAIQYSAIVRVAFIGKKIIDDLHKMGFLKQQEYENIWYSIKTITTEQKKALKAIKEGKMTKKEFLDKYECIRPNLFNIESDSMYIQKNYFQEAIAQLLNKEGETNLKKKDYYKKEIDRLFEAHGLEFSYRKLLYLTQKMFYYREKIKYEISKDVFSLFKWINNNNLFQGKQISFLGLNDILFSNIKDAKEIDKLIHEEKARFEENNLLLLPDYIRYPWEATQFTLAEIMPTYVTTKQVKGEIIEITSTEKWSNRNLSGKIVLISHADPGYDWLFDFPIKALLTMYGGIASHMTLRAHEMNLPAIIGLGEKRYNEIKKKQNITIDCAQKKYW